MGKRVVEFKGLFNELENKKFGILSKNFKKYVVDYKIKDNNIRVYNTNGDYRIIKNTKSNVSKLNKTIVKNKLEIIKKIDEYENDEKERLIILIINCLLLIGTGITVPLTLFMGSYLIFLLSIILFSFSVLTTSITTINYYLQVKEIQNLKRITGYKKEMEFKLPTITLKQK